MKLTAAILAGVCATGMADVYMHNPRGSNDRNCERNVNRNNGNRMFDSQNNAKGGYACPRRVSSGEETDQTPQMYYLTGSVLPIEWTNQHGCGADSKVNCEVILQYACEDTLDPADEIRAASNFIAASRTDAERPFATTTDIAAPRDGVPRDQDDAATDTIPNDEGDARPNTVERRRFGMHESVDSYNACNRVARNGGLFTADQNVRRRDATGTRQNPNGNRNGLECPEERDYYPHWAPNPWIDVAVLTSAWATRCDYYQAESQNVKATGYCRAATQAVLEGTDAYNNRQWPNNEADCAALATAEGTTDIYWQTVAPKNEWTDRADRANIQAPVCGPTGESRPNHLGNSEPSGVAVADVYGGVSETDNSDNVPQDGNANRFLWTIPNHVSDACTLRLRYNISTADYEAWGTDAAPQSTRTALTSADNGENSPIQQDPYVTISTDETEAETMFLSLAVNTNQYGRTFQDRSFVFAVKDAATTLGVAANTLKTPENPTGTVEIFNLNTRGKRGNIVQTYPSVEYDMVPNTLNVKPTDYVHFQWTGSDYNPRRGCNNGEGGPPDPNNRVNGDNANQNSRADRTNIIEMSENAMNWPKTATELGTGSMFPNTATQMSMAFLNQVEILATDLGETCLTQDELDNIGNANERENHPRNCAKLNAAFHPYFDGGAQQLNTGTFSYFSSRNNNFSNRDQTSSLCVNTAPGSCSVLTTPPGANVDSGSSTYVPIDDSQMLTGDTFAFQEQDNDALGDGNPSGCEELSWFPISGVTTEEAVWIAIVTLFVGMVFAVVVYKGYQRYRSPVTDGKGSKFKSKDPKSWQRPKENEMI